MALSDNGSRNIRWLLIFILLMMVLLTAINIYLLLDRRAPAVAGIAPEPIPEITTPIFVRVDPFTVNLQNDGYGRSLLYTALWLQVDDDSTRDYLTQHMPQVRSQLLTLLSAQEVTLATSPDGKQVIAGKIRDMLTQNLASPAMALAISRVLFSEFIVQ